MEIHGRQTNSDKWLEKDYSIDETKNFSIHTDKLHVQQQHKSTDPCYWKPTPIYVEMQQVCVCVCV